MYLRICDPINRLRIYAEYVYYTITDWYIFEVFVSFIFFRFSCNFFGSLLIYC